MTLEKMMTGTWCAVCEKQKVQGDGEWCDSCRNRWFREQEEKREAARKEKDAG